MELGFPTLITTPRASYEYIITLREKYFPPLIIMSMLYINKKTGDARSLLEEDPCDPSPENLQFESQGMGQGFPERNGCISLLSLYVLRWNAPLSFADKELDFN